MIAIDMPMTKNSCDCPLIDLTQYEDDLKQSTIGQRNGGMPERKQPP